MSAKDKKHAPEVDEASPELDALLAEFTEEEIETGVVALAPEAPVPMQPHDASDLQKRFANAMLEASLSRLLRSARSNAHLSLTDVAERLGVSRSWVHQLEKEGANLQIDTLNRLADALGYDVQVSFIARSDDEPTLSTPLR